jgi:hypothetical protein
VGFGFERGLLGAWARACWWVVARAFGLLVVIGVLGGIAADIPEIRQTPGVPSVLGFFSSCLKVAIHLLWNYPIEVLITVVGVSFFRAIAVHKPLQRRKKAFRERRTTTKKRAASGRPGKGKR